jgi:hypothetical protein
MGKDAFVWDCGGIGRMKAMYKLGIIGYLVSGEFGGGSDSGGEWKGRRDR